MLGETIVFSTNGVLRISITCFPIGFGISSTGFKELGKSSINFLRFSK